MGKPRVSENQEADNSGATKPETTSRLLSRETGAVVNGVKLILLLEKNIMGVFIAPYMKKLSWRSNNEYQT